MGSSPPTPAIEIVEYYLLTLKDRLFDKSWFFVFWRLQADSRSVVVQPTWRTVQGLPCRSRSGCDQHLFYILALIDRAKILPVRRERRHLSGPQPGDACVMPQAELFSYQPQGEKAPVERGHMRVGHIEDRLAGHRMGHPASTGMTGLEEPWIPAYRSDADGGGKGGGELALGQRLGATPDMRVITGQPVDLDFEDLE